MATEPKHLVLIGDLVGSRDLPDRAEVQRRLEQLLHRLKEGHSRPLGAPPAIAMGDEVQVFFRAPGEAVRRRPVTPDEVADALLGTVVGLTEGLRPVPVTFGVGRGTLSTDRSRSVGRMDGPCFHRAREALEAARSDRQWVRLRGFAAPLQAALDALFCLMGALRGGWTDKQATYARLARDRLQKEVAEHCGVSPSVVSESLKAAGVASVREGEAAARRLLAAALATPVEWDPGS